MAQAKSFRLDAPEGRGKTVEEGVEHAIFRRRPVVIYHEDDNNAVEIRPQKDGTYGMTIHLSGRRPHSVKARDDEALLYLAQRAFGEVGRDERPPRTIMKRGDRVPEYNARVGDRAWGAYIDGNIWAPFNSRLEAAKFAKSRGGAASNTYRVALDNRGKWVIVSKEVSGYYRSHRINPRRSRRNPGSGSSDRIAAFRRIVKNWQAEKVDGVLVDAFSASAIVQVYDALKETNRMKFLALPAHKMAIVAFKVLKA